MKKKIKLIFYPLLLVLSWIYQLIVHYRNYKFLINDNRSAHLGPYTWSVGNISLGGTGKTPMVHFLATHLGVNAHHPFLMVTRGYKSKVEQSGKVISWNHDHENSFDREVDFHPSMIGDEPYLLVKKLPAGTMIIGADRLKNVQKFARTNFNFIEDVILEDGFQHHHIAKNCNIVMWDALLKSSDFKIFPLGHLRENLVSLWRADVVIITKVNLISSQKLQELQNFLKTYVRQHVPLLTCEYQIASFQSVFGLAKIDLKQVLTKKWILVAALAHNEAFLQILKQMGIEVVGHFFYSDHFAFQASHLNDWQQLAERLHAGIICTEKDAVKIRQLKDPNREHFYFASLLLKFKENEIQSWAAHEIIRKIWRPT